MASLEQIFPTDLQFYHEKESGTENESAKKVSIAQCKTD